MKTGHSIRSITIFEHHLQSWLPRKAQSSSMAQTVRGTHQFGVLTRRGDSLRGEEGQQVRRIICMFHAISNVNSMSNGSDVLQVKTNANWNYNCSTNCNPLLFCFSYFLCYSYQQNSWLHLVLILKPVKNSRCE